MGIFDSNTTFLHCIVVGSEQEQTQLLGRVDSRMRLEFTNGLSDKLESQRLLVSLVICICYFTLFSQSRKAVPRRYPVLGTSDRRVLLIGQDVDDQRQVRFCSFQTAAAVHTMAQTSQHAYLCNKATLAYILSPPILLPSSQLQASSFPPLISTTWCWRILLYLCLDLTVHICLIVSTHSFFVSFFWLQVL
jgi:hypothetical protein